MNFKIIKKWLSNKLAGQQIYNFEPFEEIERLVKENDEIRRQHNKVIDDYINLEKSNEFKRIALIFITTLLIVSLISNAIQIFN